MMTAGRTKEQMGGSAKCGKGKEVGREGGREGGK